MAYNKWETKLLPGYIDISSGIPTVIDGFVDNRALYETMPQWFKDIIDYDALMMTEEIEFDRLLNDLYLLADNCFIATIGGSIIEDYEHLFGLNGSGMGIAVRRARILLLYFL